MKLILDSTKRIKRKSSKKVLKRYNSLYHNCDDEFYLYSTEVTSLLDRLDYTLFDKLNSSLNLDVISKLCDNFNKELSAIIKNIVHIKLSGFWLTGKNSGYKFYSAVRSEYSSNYQSYGMDYNTYEREIMLVQQLEKKFLVFVNFFNNVLKDSRIFDLSGRYLIVYAENPKYKLDVSDYNPDNYFYHMKKFILSLKSINN